VNYDPNDDERHYQPRGRLDPKPPREPKFTSISGVGKRLIESLRPHVSDDLKQRLSISLAGYLFPWVLLPIAFALGWWARGHLVISVAVQ
jgi:hypothetical protein